MPETIHLRWPTPPVRPPRPTLRRWWGLPSPAGGTAGAVACLALCAGLGAALPARAGLLLDLTAPGDVSVCGTCGSTGSTYGYSFDVAQALWIDALGAWDQDGDGLGVATSVGLFADDGTLLASAVVDDGSASPAASALADGRWLMVGIAPVVLAPGSYRLGQVFFDGLPVAQVDAAYASPLISVTGGAISPLFDAGLDAPLTPFSLLVVGGTLSGGVVPEPASFGLAGVALLAAGLVGRRRRASAPPPVPHHPSGAHHA